MYSRFSVIREKRKHVKKVAKAKTIKNEQKSSRSLSDCRAHGTRFHLEFSEKTSSKSLYSWLEVSL
jgi:hypothetical protein